MTPQLQGYYFVNISHQLIFKFWSNKKLGKEEWKYLPFIHPPHPSKHASTDNISSGLENSSDNIMETPLYNGKNLFHHNKSSFRSSGMQNESLSDISLSQFNKREIQILPGFTH